MWPVFLFLLISGATFSAAADTHEGLPSSHRDTIHIVAEPELVYQEISEGGVVHFPIHLRDESWEGMVLGGSTPTRCTVDRNTTDAKQWGAVRRGSANIGRDDEATVYVTVSAGIRASPEFFTVDVTCTAGGEEIASFPLTTRMQEYDYITLFRLDPPLTLKPEESFTYSLEVTNNGNRDRVFRGSVETPEGWTLTYPRSLSIPAGQSEIVEITGKAPRDKLWYIYDSSLVEVTYWPDTSPNKAQTENIPFTVNGFYLHPALIPLILLGILSVFLLVLLVAFARRTVEEELLGKPIPPWRIPVEREYLKRLEKEDPDEFYIVRHHLMVEEHASALLWFNHFKGATKKDRRLERRWLKKKKKVGTKNARLEARHERLESRTGRRLRVLPTRRRRVLARLAKKALRDQWREQRKLLKIHRKSVKKIDGLHAKQAKAVEKRHAGEHQKEFKRIERENKKRLKKGEEPLALPDESALEIPEPEFPAVVEVPITPAKQSRYAALAARKNDRFKRRIKRRSSRAGQKIGKKSDKKHERSVRLRENLPPEPETHLYATDEFVSEEQVVVEDARNPMMRLVNLPDMETRDQLNRRRNVYKAAVRKAKEAKDEGKVAKLKSDWEEEKKRLLGRGQREEADGKSPRGAPSTKKPGKQSSSSGGKTALLSRLRQKTPKGDAEATGEPDAGDQNLKE